MRKTSLCIDNGVLKPQLSSNSIIVSWVFFMVKDNDFCILKCSPTVVLLYNTPYWGVKMTPCCPVKILILRPVFEVKECKPMLIMG